MNEMPVATEPVASNLRFSTDGHLVPVVPGHLVAGNVLRGVSRDGGQSAFSDCVVLKVWETQTLHKLSKITWVRLARPYAFVSGVGTTCPSVLTGVEEFEVEASRLIESGRYKTVLQSTGLPAEMKVGR